jgi:AraC family transcriptional regulator of adaptative response / DNA-3-methyladenine glycosylase II
LRLLARAVRDGGVVFDGLATLDSLRAIPGIGDWTAQYVAMRALNEPDAFPSGDLVLRRMAGDCSARELERRSEAWRPWRAYAVMLLWQAAKDRDQQVRRTQHAHVDNHLRGHRVHGDRASDRHERADWR